jgi:hypothetical protein
MRNEGVRKVANVEFVRVDVVRSFTLLIPGIWCVLRQRAL